MPCLLLCNLRPSTVPGIQYELSKQQLFAQRKAGENMSNGWGDYKTSYILFNQVTWILTPVFVCFE